MSEADPRTDRIRVYVAGPYSSNPEGNTDQAIKTGQWLLEEGFAPMVPHLTHFWDEQYPNDWLIWLELDLPWVAQADCVFRMPGHSKGADIEVGYAKALGIPVYHDEQELIDHPPQRKGEEWRPIQTGRETVRLADSGCHSNNSGLRTDGSASGITGAKSVMGSTSEPGTTPIPNGAETSDNARVSELGSGSGDMGLPETTTTNYSRSSTSSVQSAEWETPAGHYISTTTMKREASAVFCARDATPESGSSDMILNIFSGPPGTFHDGSVRFYEKLAEIGLLHLLKQRDYGHGKDPFANVRASSDWGIAPWVGALVRLNDKVKRLQTFARTHHLTNEGAQDSLLDIAVYALIASVLLDEASETE